jgi:8-oxo-dGTP diphosphatase
VEPTNSNELLVRGSHVVAVAALIVRAGVDGLPRVLAMRRAGHRSAGPGLWETLSGRVEQGEEPLAALVREIDEECGLTVRVEPRLFTAYAALRRDLPMIVIAYRARWLSGEVRRSSEHDAHAWLTPAAFRAQSTLTTLADVVAQALSEPL